MRVLVLGGTGEGRELATRLAERGVQVTTSLAGGVRRPASPAGELRTGGFGGTAGLADHLRAHAVDVVVDATHPFAATITRQAVEACALVPTPLLTLRRPGWTAGPGDRWTRVASVEAAAAQVRAAAPGTVFLTTGRRDLAAFAADDAHAFLVRSVDPPQGRMPARTTVVLDRGPFALQHELQLMRAHGVDLLVTKDSGGAATASKLEAARQLGLPVVIVDRPPLPPGVEALPSVEDVLARLPA